MRQILFIVVSLFFVTQSSGQDDIGITCGVGAYAYNTENEYAITKNENYILNFTFAAYYVRALSANYRINVSYNFMFSKINDALLFAITAPNVPEALGQYGVDIKLMFNMFDFNLDVKLNKNYYISMGPTLALVFRSLVIDHHSFKDELASVCGGLNVVAAWYYPIDNSKMYYQMGIKTRFLTGLFFDRGMRNIDDYNQSFITVNLELGLGFSL